MKNKIVGEGGGEKFAHIRGLGSCAIAQAKMEIYRRNQNNKLEESRNSDKVLNTKIQLLEDTKNVRERLVSEGKDTTKIDKVIEKLEGEIAQS